LSNAVWFWFRAACFFQFTCIGWLLFRAESVEQVGDMLGTILRGGIRLPGWSGMHIATLVSCFALFGIVQITQWYKRDLLFVMRLPMALRVLVYVAGILAFILFGNFSGGAFIYFQF
ncbi:MAG: hypothetical protein AAF432_10325, partial [Planctomycetota bacterium]